jgi:hypothetical protein
MQQLSFSWRYRTLVRVCTVPAMTTIAQVRRANLNLLLQEVGEGRGAAAKLATITGVKAPIISQLRRVTYYPNGVERTMGDDVARQLERHMAKPVGWMDHPHESTHGEDEAMFLRMYRALTPEQREELARLAGLFSKSNRGIDGEAAALDGPKVAH